ncbi:pentapeptide repeat-containing protein [Dactylosporangium sp. NPDC000521]|uniref:pentapeptide repeat-containing protein n=1 Tax=Dactylosporangium sp. NPDC000521 TaxID=3363975 RepID=UPI0036C5DFA1
MPTIRFAGAAGALLIIAVLVGAAPAAAEPTRGPDCPETRAQLAGQHITSTEGLPDLTCADLHGAILDGLDLGQEDLSRIDAHGASFRGTDLVQATLTGANLRGARFDNADLTQAHLDIVDARDASFADADLGQADLPKADLRGADFTGASLSQADLPDADLRGADFTGASLTQADLSGADLRGARTLFAGAIQADAEDAKVDILDPRTLQVALLAILIGLVLLVKSLINVLRGLTPGDRPLKRGLARLAVYTVVSLMIWLPAGMVLPLMFVSVLYPWLVGALLVYLSGAVRGYRPARFGRFNPDPDPSNFSINFGTAR